MEEMEGFFKPSELASAAIESTTPRCGMCGLYRTCKSPKMKRFGEGRKKILLIGEAPGEKEDLKGIPFVGKSGILLRETLKDFGINMSKDCWRTNAVRCRPPKNATPTETMVNACRPTLLKEIKKIKPKLIILLGASAVNSVIPMLWKDDVGPLARWVGWNIPSQKFNAWVCPTYHPSWVLRSSYDVCELILESHIRKAVKHKRRPWKTIPDYKKYVYNIIRPSRAAKRIRQLNPYSDTAWDLETNCLRPEREGSEIVSCSVCQNPKEAFSFPWEGEAVEAMLGFLKSKTPKIGANIKYEHRWIQCKYGKKVKSWSWDTMIAAHVLDNRSAATSLKFQSFVKLGLPEYDSHIKPYLQATKGSHLNSIRKLPIEEVLTYNGIDSLATFLLAQKQKKEMGDYYGKV